MYQTSPVVIRGGYGKGKADSIRSGSFVLQNLSHHKNVLDVLIDRDGWHLAGSRIDPEKLLSKRHHIFINTLSEKDHDDFKIRKLIEGHRATFVGSKTFPSLLAFNKHLSKDIFGKIGIKIPKHEVIGITDDIEGRAFKIFRSYNLPVLIKSSRGGGSHGLTLARTFGEIIFGLKNAFAHSPKVMVEEYIRGREISCTLVENFRDNEVYAFPLAEILKDREIMDREMKSASNYRSVFPARIKREESDYIREVVKKAHRALGLGHYSRSDLILSPRGLYLLEINSSPELSEGSLFHQSLEEGGMSAKQFLDHVINLAIEKK